MAVAEAGSGCDAAWTWKPAEVLFRNSNSSADWQQLLSMHLAVLRPTETKIDFLWRIKSPPNILHFGWRILLNRLATKDQLLKRGMLMEDGDSACVFCHSEEENLHHLLGGCKVLSCLWRKVFEWLGPFGNVGLEDFEGFFDNFEKVKAISKRMIIAVVWLATVWSIWLRRNAIIFRGESYSFTECMSGIIWLAWMWLQSFYVLKDGCNFYIWNILPLTCFE
ncbi:uncharacterized protein LOC131634951 [Vicia villosa]|uniref:uncharacterized protein LOC131634951 n=1 Tax=Vicia villosa TaxID=3911 RepID=UPI00273AAF90|nr:uncharacterized protein LOC131634951 [Vicia villosa]